MTHDPRIIEAACVVFLSAEFDELGEHWFHPSERANFIHYGIERMRPKMRAALEEAERARCCRRCVHWRHRGEPGDDITWCGNRELAKMLGVDDPHTEADFGCRLWQPLPPPPESKP